MNDVTTEDEQAASLRANKVMTHVKLNFGAQALISMREWSLASAGELVSHKGA